MIENEILYANEAWAKALKSAPYFKMRIRTEQEIKEYWDKIADKFDSNMLGLEEDRVNRVMEQLIKNKYITGASNILDLGSGTGAYTIPMAERANNVTALDSSKEMCNILSDKAKNKNLTNIQIKSESWENVDLKKENLNKRFDLVFSSLNPGVKNMETLKKMNEASTKHCCLISTSGAVEDSTRTVVGELLLGENLKSERANDVIYPFYILYNLGYSPKMEYIDITFVKEKEPKEAITSICDSFWLYTDITAQVKSTISDYVYENLIDGRFKSKTKMKLGMVYWTVG
ncbi:methyltransferase domain-containing protein [Proteinivorax tanatarense]|uniref:Methyltransferase domain-containing protein n=1 Tax=Proteinivorax tanatarense TaxID=1260629 RepID=A0AAU7VN90_9FIRM